jgi:hypothetical protein
VSKVSVSVEKVSTAVLPVEKLSFLHAKSKKNNPKNMVTTKILINI